MLIQIGKNRVRVRVRDKRGVQIWFLCGKMLIMVLIFFLLGLHFPLYGMHFNSKYIEKPQTIQIEWPIYSNNCALDKSNNNHRCSFGWRGENAEHCGWYWISGCVTVSRHIIKFERVNECVCAWHERKKRQ